MSIVRRLLSILLIACRIAFVGCPPWDANKDQPMSGKTINQVLKYRTTEWMAISGVEGTAIGLFEDKPCIKIFSSRKAEELRAKIPTTIEGYPVIIEETGSFRALEQ